MPDKPVQVNSDSLKLDPEFQRYLPPLTADEHDRLADSLRSEGCRDPLLGALPQPLEDVAVFLLDSGLRIGEALTLEWPQVHLDPADGARFGYVTILARKSKGKRSRNVPLSERAKAILDRWRRPDGYVFHEGGNMLCATRLDAQHARVRRLLKLPQEFVLHSLRHTFGTRLGESGADAFTVMRLMGHSNVTVSQRYVHPSPESVELAFERFELLNEKKRAVAAGLPTNPPTTPAAQS